MSEMEAQNNHLSRRGTGLSTDFYQTSGNSVKIPKKRTDFNKFMTK